MGPRRILVSNIEQNFLPSSPFCSPHLDQAGLYVISSASLIPAVRRIFRRPSDDEKTSNDTEYAFQRSKGLISRTWDLVKRNGALASMALFVLSVLYVFQAEVSLRVARTVSRRLKRLIQRIEIGNEVLDERDVDIFQGWRWRVLTWKS